MRGSFSWLPLCLFISQLDIVEFIPSLLYFGYTTLMVLSFWLLTGTIGFYAAYMFIRKIYAAVKIDWILLSCYILVSFFFYTLVFYILFVQHALTCVQKDQGFIDMMQQPHLLVTWWNNSRANPPPPLSLCVRTETQRKSSSAGTIHVSVTPLPHTHTQTQQDKA